MGFWGVIKETGVDDEGLTEFYQQYYNFPLYRDKSLATYASFGNKSIFSGMSWNPFKLYRGMKQLSKRLKEKNLEGNMKGEGIIKGGIFVLNNQGEVVYAMEENTGVPLDMDELESAIEALKMTKSEQDTVEL